MTLIANPAQCAHLPPPPPGQGYRLRTIGAETYITTGSFPDAAPDATLPHLGRAGALICDCDLVDFEARRVLTRAERKDLKVRIQSLPDAELTAKLDALAGFALGWIRHVTGVNPTFTVISGYGIHFYQWLPEHCGYGAEIEAVRRANANLVARVNAAVGFHLADPQAHDAGTRILRPLGAVNRKNPQAPRPVRVLWADPGARVDFRPLAALSAPPPPPPPDHSPSNSAGAVAGAAVGSGPSDVWSKVFEQNEERAVAFVNQMMNECPFFVWAVDNPEKLGRESWRGAALNIAALAGEVGRRAFHAFSSLDSTRYDPAATDRLYTDSVKSATTHGPMTYAAFLRNGDWPGPPPENVKAPAALRFQPGAELRTISGVKLDKFGKPYKTQGNLRKILRNHPVFGLTASGGLRFNEMKQALEFLGRPVSDAFYGHVLETIEDETGTSFPREAVVSCTREIAAERTYHPVRDYLRSLAWDGKPRTDSILADVLNVEPSPLNRGFLRAFLVSAVARVMDESPQGVKVDSALILKGDQGIRKSTFFRILANEWFTDTSIDLRSKDAYMTLRSAWIVEWGEFEHTLNRTEMSAVKSFMTSQVDSYRPPSGREQIEIPRRCVITGTTNEDHFLFDPTGDRRFWVIDVGRNRIDTDALRGMRDQVWAEAVAAHLAGERTYLNPDLDAARADANTAYRVEEPWHGLISQWIDGKGDKGADVGIEDCLRECIQKDAKDWKRADYQVIGAILRTLGFHRYRVHVGGRRFYRFRKIGATQWTGPGEPGTAPAASNVIAFPGF